MMLHGKLIGVCVALIAISACSTSLHGNSSRGDQDYDLVILNGRVVDPETGLDAVRNVGVQGDKIAIVTERQIQGKKHIDATDKVVAPGFIDLHAHGQRILAGRVQALDGVTTALELEAGMLPLAEYYDKAASEGRPIHYGAAVNWAHARIAAKTGDEPSGGVEFFFSHFGDPSWQEELATEEELNAIIERVQQGLDEGGLGIGFLLGYAPGAGRKEYHALNKLAAENGVPTFTHARFLSAVEPDSSFESYQEMIAVAASTGAHMHICHLNSMSLRDVHDIAVLISGAQKNGIRITAEAYPYGAGGTGIGAAMFRGKNWQARLGGIKKSDFTLAGKPLSDAEFDRLQEEAPGTIVLVHILHPEKYPEDQTTLDTSVLYPGGAIASDGGTWGLDNGVPLDQETWPLPADAKSHPRSAGAFSKFLRVYVRERKVISLIDAIEKTSLIPAQILEASVPQMRAKGRIQEGADADIVVFDLATVSDRSTYEKHAQTSVGFEHVIVAGTQLVENAILDADVLPGKAIRRAQKAYEQGERR